MFSWNDKRLNTSELIGICSWFPMTKVMNSTWFRWFHTVIYSFVLTAICLHCSLTSATQISYAEHCNSVIPESSLKRFESASPSFAKLHTGYYIGGHEILSLNPSENSSPLTVRTSHAFQTDEDGVFGIEGSLLLRSQNPYYYEREVANVKSYNQVAISHRSATRRRSSVRFRLHGLWSESSGNLCTVARGYTYNSQGNLLKLEAVLKLSHLKNSSSITTLVSGSLESLSSTTDETYFEPISMLILPRMSYEYTLVSNLSDEVSGGNDNVKSLPLSSLPRKSFCSAVSRAVNEFNLKYASDCSSAKSCGPFGAAAGYLPPVLSLKEIECLEEEKRLRVLLEFVNSSYVGYYQPFDFSKTLVAEGVWDEKMNQLCVVACRFLNTAESLANAYVGDCTTRLSLSYPAIWSITDTSNIMGRIWTKKEVNDSSYFGKILFQNSENSFGAVPGLKYEYTEINRTRKLCWLKGRPGKTKGKIYPNGYSYDMQFNIRVTSPNANSSWGYATPLSVGDQFYRRYLYPVASTNSESPTSEVQKTFSHNSPVNISYKIGIRLLPGVNLAGHIAPPDKSMGLNEKVDISAEGIYDEETGQLCMVGCRNIVSNYASSITDTVDCEILISFQFPPSNPEKNKGYIKGSIKSTREVSDPLYFEPLDVFSNSYTAVEVVKSISRIDWEVVMALISSTLACLFVGLQLFHVKKHPEVLPSISLVTLLLLILSHMIPLVLNFEAFFLQNRDRQNALFSTSGWLEMNEALVRIITMVAFLLEFRLLQLTWSAKLADEAKQTGLWFAEKSTLFLSLPLYAAGAFIFLLANEGHYSHDIVSVSSPPGFYPRPQSSLWCGLKSYAGLVLDGYLLPQILLNIFRNSKENALSCSFYIGTSFSRSLLHAYSILYCNADFFTDTWNTIICLLCLLFAAIIFLQQRFGGRCIVPGVHRDGKEYEKVPAVSES